MGKLMLTALLMFLVWSSPAAAQAPSTDSASFKTERLKMLEEKKAAIQAQREAAKQNKLDARQKWVQVRDENKLRLLEKIEVNLDHINERTTNHFMDVLARLQLILDKINSRAQKDLKNVTEITAAQTVIDNAESAVAVQAAKTYDLDITAEATASGQVRTAMQQLKSDLGTVRELVRQARQAVHTAFLALKNSTL